MEAYKSTCPDCKAVYFWTGRKTAFNEEQAKRMHQQETVCRKCGSTNLKTGLDFESDAGKEMGEMYHDILQNLG
jgi:RNA polymerase subunit RPABC4/transcription elongation factor Spt4